MKMAIAPGLICFGIVLFLLSGVWTSIFPPTASWTEQKAKRADEVKSRLYNLAAVVNSPRPNLQRGQDIGQLKAEFEQLKKENDELDVSFNSATQTPNTVSRVLRWSGVSVLLAGIVGWYAVNQSS